MVAKDDAASRLAWFVRRHAVLVLLSVIVFTAVGAVLQPREVAPTFRAEALVVARDLAALRVEQLPRMASTVFRGGNVARNTVQAGDLPIADTELIPEFASLEPIEGTLLLRVVGTAPDAELAGRIANAAADALTAELNRAGPTIARFAIQEAAVTPESPENQQPPNLIVIGALAGLFMGLGFMMLLVTVRRPILSLAELRDLVEEPVLPGPALPPPGRPVELVRTPGLSAAVKQFYANGTERCAFVSCRGGGRWRSQTALAVALLLTRRGPVTLVASAEPGAERLYRKALFPRDIGPIKNLVLVGSADEAPAGVPLVLDGLSAGTFDVPQLLPPGTRSILVVPQGSTASTVTAALRQFLPGELTAILFVPCGTGWKRPPRRRHPTSTTPGPEEADRRGDPTYAMTWKLEGGRES